MTAQLLFLLGGPGEVIVIDLILRLRSTTELAREWQLRCQTWIWGLTASMLKFNMGCYALWKARAQRSAAFPYIPK